MNAPASPFAQELTAALEWWEMAGVDCDFADDATDWLAKAEREDAVAPAGKQSSQAAQAPPTPPEPETRRANLLGPDAPGTLEAFHQFWLEAPGLDAIGPRGRVAPRGPANPELMVLVIDPEERDVNRLLSGPQGRLLDRIIAATGIEADSVYIASALPRHMPMADTSALAAAGMAEITTLHVNLVAPQRLLAFGASIPPLLGHALTKDLSSLREINQKSRPIPLLVSEGLESLLGMPRLKARFWRRWMEWSADL